eukprot:gnl/MRDRNA2_/MRDRNA2_178697_c0_seq1.p1 gnl/MRDRNA2_/MRDRNA2_178697_c0~~gnl/MRDRNA2_/MRDRNA2_178697_c0_seq1.p1  ORF type:complete len:454 (+),score=71.88 gnl/MRDRNA2_/MRDRNA2_178697_c0_seq1:137-1498(+)
MLRALAGVHSRMLIAMMAMMTTTLQAQHTYTANVQNTTVMLMDKLISKLFERAVDASPSHLTGLQNTVLAKSPSQLATGSISSGIPPANLRPKAQASPGFTQALPHNMGNLVSSEWLPHISCAAMRVHASSTSSAPPLSTEDQKLIDEELSRCGEIIDPHLHCAPWFSTADKLIEELEGNSIDRALLFDPYSRRPYLPMDVNTFVHSIASASKGKIFMLASLNTTHDNWEEHREQEIERLKSFLEKDEALGAKLAPPHTCLPLTGPIMDDVVETVSQSSKKLLAIHIGTTPYCGPLGKQLGIVTDCTAQCVDPSLIEPKIRQYPDVKFVLLHSGHEFLPSDSPHYYDFNMADKCIALAKTYPNVFLSISALFAQTPDGVMKYPGGEKIVQKMKDADVCHKVFWGSDASFIQGQIQPVLITAIKTMIKAGWTEEERSWALSGCAKKLFRLPDPV